MTTGETETPELLISIEDLLQTLQVEAEWLRRAMFSTLATSGKGPGARRYSKTRLGMQVEQVRGMKNLVVALISDRVPGGEIPADIRLEVTTKIREANYVAQGRNLDGTDPKEADRDHAAR